MLRFLVLALIASGAANSEERTLIERVPRGADDAVVMAIVKQAFLGRRWKIESEDPAAIVAHNGRTEFASKMRISLVNGSLRYTETTKARTVPSNPNKPAVPGHGIKLDTPDNWVRNLRLDIAAALSAIPDETPARDIASRLKILNDLKASSVITDAEYAAKRAEILQAF